MKSKNHSKIKAILWDMDGVVIDSSKHHAMMEIETMSRHNIPYSEEISKQYEGINIVDHFTDYLNKKNISIPVETLINSHRETLKKYANTHYQLVQNAKKILEKLSKNYSMAIVTSSERDLVEIVIKKFSLRESFQAVITREDIKKGKPNPEPFITGAQKLNVNSDEVVVIEDSLAGFKSAKAAGMLLIGYKAEHNKHVDFSLADFIVEDLREIPEILEKINKES